MDPVVPGIAADRVGAGESSIDGPRLGLVGTSEDDGDTDELEQPAMRDRHSSDRARILSIRGPLRLDDRGRRAHSRGDRHRLERGDSGHKRHDDQSSARPVHRRVMGLTNRWVSLHGRRGCQAGDRPAPSSLPSSVKLPVLRSTIATGELPSPLPRSSQRPSGDHLGTEAKPTGRPETGLMLLPSKSTRKTVGDADQARRRRSSHRSTTLASTRASAVKGVIDPEATSIRIRAR